MAKYELPQFRVFQDLDPAVEPAERQMLPVIIGQRRDLFSYAPEAESDTGKVGDYTMSSDILADWDGLGANSTVIRNTVRLYGEDLKVSLVKAGYADDIKCLSPLFSTFNPIDYFTPVNKQQENVLVFCERVENEEVMEVIEPDDILTTNNSLFCWGAGTSPESGGGITYEYNYIDDTNSAYYTNIVGYGTSTTGSEQLTGILSMPTNLVIPLELESSGSSPVTMQVKTLTASYQSSNSGAPEYLEAVQFPEEAGVTDLSDDGITGYSCIELGEGVFKDCAALSRVNLQPSLKVIPTEAFMNCTSLVTLTLPATVTTIEADAFKGCTNLETIYILGTSLPTVAPTAFTDCPKLVIRTLDSVGNYSENSLGGRLLTSTNTATLAQSINLAGADFYRTPEVGDFIKVRQTSQDTVGQRDDWTAQIVGLVETETQRANKGVGTPKEPIAINGIRANTFDATTRESSLEITTEVFGDSNPSVTYRIVPLQDIACQNAEYAHLAKYQEMALNRVCETGLFNLGDLGYKVRVSNVTAETMDITVQSKLGNQSYPNISIDKFVKCPTSNPDTLWFRDVAEGLYSVGDLLEDSRTPSDEADIIGGLIIEDTFLLYAETTVDGAVTNYVRNLGETTLTLDEVYDLNVGDYIIVNELGGNGETMNGRYRLTAVSASESTVTYKNVGNNVTSTLATGTFYKCPVKNDSFELSGSIERPGQRYNGEIETPIVTANSEFDSLKDTVYTIEVIEGGCQDCSKHGLDNHYPDISLRVSTNNALDPVEVHKPVINWDPETQTGDSTSMVPIGASEIRIGRKGVVVQFFATPREAAVNGQPDFNLLAFSKGDVWTIECTGRSGDQVVGVITDKKFDHFRSNIEAQRFDVEFMEELRGSTEIPRLQADAIENWEINPEPVDGVDYDLRVISGAQVRVDDLNTDLTISDGAIYMSYEAVNNTNTGSVVRVTDASDIRDELGPDDPRNPLGYGARKALLNAQGTPVLVVSMDEMTDDNTDDALALLSQNNNAYQLVPMTFDESIQNKIIAHALSMSTELMDLWRCVYIATDIGHEYGIVTVDAANEQVTGTFEQYNDSYNKLTLDPSTVGVSFIDSKVKAGHIVRYAYDEDMYGEVSYKEFTVLSVLNATELLVLGDYGSPSSTMDISIYKDTASEDIVYEVGNRSEGLDSRRVTNVFPATATDDNDRTVPGYFVAAALAGLAAGSEPHQGQTNSKILGFSEVSTLAPMRRMDVLSMNDLAAKGVTIITGEASDIGVRHELTTNMSDRKNRETMVTRNLDSISYQYFDALSPFIGIANVTPEFVQKIRTELTAIGSSIIASSQRPLIGSQMIGVSTSLVEQDAVFADKINIRIAPMLPLPFNYGDLHIQI